MTEIRALTALRRLRHLEADAARRDLGEALAAETVLAARDAAIARELGDARSIIGEYDRDAFGAFLARARAERTVLAGAMREAEARTGAAREALTRQRLAARAAEEVWNRATAARAAEAARKDQHEMEDVARAMRRR